MMKRILRTYTGADGTEYRQDGGIEEWLKEAFASLIGFFGPIAVGCLLMTVAHWIGWL